MSIQVLLLEFKVKSKLKDSHVFPCAYHRRLLLRCLKRLYTPSCVHLSHGSVPTHTHAHSCTVTLSYTITELKGTHISVITLTQRKGRKKCSCSTWDSFSVGRWPIMSTHSKIPCPGHPALEGPVLTTCSLSTPAQTPPRR